ncbi:hypothetical protein FRB98_004702 [Tulasnella sp. 332]|nr:hypothetical protein FRB98_004702 [Tulasnella sp. 332]
MSSSNVSKDSGSNGSLLNGLWKQPTALSVSDLIDTAGPESTSQPTPEAPKPRTQGEIAESTKRIKSKLRLLQADDIAQLGEDRKSKGYGLLGTAVTYGETVSFNLTRYIRYLFDTWSTFVIGCITGKLNPSEAFSVIFFSAGASAVLILIFTWCTIATYPPIVWAYNLLFGNISGHLSLVNSCNPNIFKCLTQEQSEVAKKKLGAEIDPNGHNPRIFDLDIAKLLLQLSSLMYERDIKPMHNAVDAARTTSTSQSSSTITRSITPGAVLNNLFAVTDITKILNTLDADSAAGEAPIHKFAKEHGICFATASELKTTSQAYCSLFWDPTGTWVLVAFKGTDPTSFDEWTTDFTATFEDCSEDIPGFRFVHKGFKDRILPSTGRQPYHSIAAAVRIVCDELVKGHAAGTKINVWFTGHSLGTAIASLAYAKALVAKDLGPYAILRDAYVYATPICADVHSRLFFDSMMQEDPNVPRTLFRVTNRNDFVATGLPEIGDSRTRGLGKDNLFNFSHLGVEIFMKDHPNPCQVRGDQVRQFKIHVKSAFDESMIRKMRAKIVARGYNQLAVLGWLQYIPIIGRLAAHGTTNYWEQLERIGLLPCVEQSD